MERVAIEEVTPAEVGSDAERRSLSEPLGTTDVSINRYRLAPGDRISGLHAHADQAEVFLVVEGDLTFETMDGVVDLGAGEAIRFAPGEFQSGKNDSDDGVELLALGTPRDSEDVRVPVACPACGNDDARPTIRDGGPVLVCPACDEESPVACPKCGGDDVRAQLAADEQTPVSVCRDCGAEWGE